MDGNFQLPVMWVVEKFTKNLMIELKLTEKYTNKGGQNINEIVKSDGLFLSPSFSQNIFLSV